MRSIGVAVAVEEGREAVLPAPVGLRRDVRHRPFALDLVADRIAVVALVAMQDRAPGHLLQEQIPGGTIGDLAAGQKERDGTAQAIAQGVDLCGSPTT